MPTKWAHLADGFYLFAAGGPRIPEGWVMATIGALLSVGGFLMWDKLDGIEREVSYVRSVMTAKADAGDVRELTIRVSDVERVVDVIRDRSDRGYGGYRPHRGTDGSQ